MNVEQTESGHRQAEKLQQQRQEVEDLQNATILEKSRLESERQKMVRAENDKNRETIVNISKEAEKQANFVRKTNIDRVDLLSETTHQNYLKLAEATAEQIRKLNEESNRKISQKHMETMEKLDFSERQAVDPFYHIQDLPASLTETDKEFLVQIPLPPHEAKNLFATTENKVLKVSLARSFAAAENTAPNTKTRSSSYQTIQQFITLPKAFDTQQIRREYSDGILTLRLTKV